MNKKFIYKLLILITIFIVTGCASQMPASNFNNELNEQNSHKLILVNTTNLLLFPAVNSINVAVDGKMVGNIDRNEFIEIYLTKGKHELMLEHWDFKFWPTTHSLMVGNNPTTIKIYSGMVSTKYSYLELTEGEISKRYTRAYLSK